MYLLTYPFRGPTDAGGRASKEATHDGHWQQPALHSNNLAQFFTFFSTKCYLAFLALFFPRSPSWSSWNVCLFGFNSFVLFLVWLIFFVSLHHQKVCIKSDNFLDSEVCIMISKFCLNKSQKFKSKIFTSECELIA